MWRHRLQEISHDEKKRVLLQHRIHTNISQTVPLFFQCKPYNFSLTPSFWHAFSHQRQQLKQWEHFSIVSMDKTGGWRPLLVLLHTHEVRPISELRGCVRRLWKGWGRGRRAFHCKETERHVEHTQAHTHTKNQVNNKSVKKELQW